MGFVGGGGNIAIATALPPVIVRVLYCKYQIIYGIFLSYFLCLHEASVSGCGDKPMYLLSAEYSVVMSGTGREP